jgi:hypothetical protein
MDTLVVLTTKLDLTSFNPMPPITSVREKRLQYEDLEIKEHWIVNVQKMQIPAFSIAPDRSIRRIRESQVLPGLKLEILEQALQRSRQENQSATTAWLMEQFRG